MNNSEGQTKQTKTNQLGQLLNTLAWIAEQAVTAHLQLFDSVNWFQRKTDSTYIYNQLTRLLQTQFSKQSQSDYVYRAIDSTTTYF